jgi:hypothetical protein
MAHPVQTGRGLLPAFAIFLLAVAASGCANLAEVKRFATLSSHAAKQDALTRDYIAALDRRKRYQPSMYHAELEAQKTRREAQQANMDVLQHTIADYMHGLAGLATGESRTYDKSLKDLSTSLSKATLLTSGEKEAVGALSTLLARSVTSGFRQNEMKKLIRDSNQPLQDVIKATRKIVTKGIDADLQVEFTLVARYYDNFMLAPGNPSEPVAMALAREARAEALGRIDARRRYVHAYDVVLEKIARGHQYLYEHTERIGNDELNEQFAPQIEELGYAYQHLLDIVR